jgi:hydrogenase/urease accessory protein HupE
LSVAVKDIDVALPEADADNNRELTWSEMQAVMPGVQRWINQHVVLTCKQAGTPPPVEPSTWVFDALEERSDGVYARLRNEWPCPLNAEVSLRYTLMKDLDPTHRAIIKSNVAGAVQAWVLAPAHPSLTLRMTSPTSAARVGQGSGWQTFLNFVPEGVHHILTGYDHLAFLLALLLPLRLRLRELLWTVTAFTLGHSVTLVLASLGLRVIPAWVEPAIAVSIGFTAWLNLYPQPWLSPRWLALGFGLIHGLGFANMMQEADLHGASLAWSLAGFNTGVELGQLMCVDAWCVINLGLNRWARYEQVVTRGGSLALIVLAIYWTWVRVVGS